VSVVHWHDEFVQCGPKVLLEQSASARHGTHVWLATSQAAKSGSVQRALEKHAPQVPLAVSQWFAPGLVQSPSAPHPQ
jgi:hypothetical protein